MALTVTATNKGSTPLGNYIFKLDHCEEAEGKDFKTGAVIPQIKWVWTIQGVNELEPSEEMEAAVGQEYWEWSGTVPTPRSKIRARIEALLGRPMENGESVDIPGLYGRRVKANVGEDTKPDGGKYVTLVTTPYQQRAARQPAPAAPPDGDDEKLPF
jgi:hypothetical protein